MKLKLKSKSNCGGEITEMVVEIEARQHSSFSASNGLTNKGKNVGRECATAALNKLWLLFERNVYV